MRYARIVPLFLFGALWLPAQTVVSSADYSPAYVNGIARGSIFTILGSDLAPSVAIADRLPLQTTLNGGTVRITAANVSRSEEHTSELQSPCNLVCRLLLEKKKKKILHLFLLKKKKKKNTKK